MEEDSIEQNSRLMDAMQKELHLLRGLEQFNLAHMMPNALDRKLLQCRPLNLVCTRPLHPKFKRPPLKPDDRNPMFNLEFGLGDQYTAVVGRVADKLQMDPARIKIARHLCQTNTPNYADLMYQFNCLKDILKRTDGTLCDILYYDVVDDSIPRNSKTVEVAYGGYPNAKQSHVAVQPGHISVEDFLNDKEVVKLTNNNEKLRLVGICEGTMCKVFSPEEKIENIPKEFSLRAEEIPKKMEHGCGGHHVIHVYNITRTDGVLKFHEEECLKPFNFVIRDDETLAGVKERLRGKLLENEEISQLKFAVLRPVGPPVLLEDDDVVMSCFKV